MTEAGTAQKLFSAARNFKALSESFALIDADSLDDRSVDGLDRLVGILQASTERIEALTGIEIGEVEPTTEKVSRSDLHLDSKKLQRAIGFAEKVSKWLDSVNAETLPGKAKTVLKELGEAIGMAGRIVGNLIQDYRGAARAGIRSPDSSSPELVMAHNRNSPLLEEWQGKQNLNTKAKAMLREYLDLCGFPDSPTETRKWERNAEKWLIATPKGMILVLRVGKLSGNASIYPKYVPRRALAGTSSS